MKFYPQVENTMKMLHVLVPSRRIDPFLDYILFIPDDAVATKRRYMFFETCIL